MHVVWPILLLGAALVGGHAVELAALKEAWQQYRADECFPSYTSATFEEHASNATLDGASLWDCQQTYGRGLVGNCLHSLKGFLESALDKCHRMHCADWSRNVPLTEDNIREGPALSAYRPSAAGGDALLRDIDERSCSEPISPYLVVEGQLLLQGAEKCRTDEALFARILELADRVGVRQGRCRLVRSVPQLLGDE